MSDYPSESELERIAEWPYQDPEGWLAFIRGIWWQADWGWHEEATLNSFDRPVHRHSISTGGWSGNEDIIGAMERNYMLWGMTWQSSRRGGHYVFEADPQRTTST